MTFDLPTPPVTLPPSDTVVVNDLYTLTCTAVPDADKIVVTLTSDHSFDTPDDTRQVSDVAVYVDGTLRVAEWGTYPPHTFTQQIPTPRRIIKTFTVVRSACPDLIRPGEALVSMRVNTNAGAYICHLKLRPILPPRPVAALVPGVVLRSLFWTPGAAEWAANPGLIQQFHDAGVNCLTVGFFHNPADSGTTVFDRTNFTANTIPVLQFARDNGFKLLLAGDDLCRNSGEQNWITTAPNAHADVVWMAQQLAAFADVIAGVPLVDEGGDPTSSQAYENAINWLREGWPGVKISVPSQYPQAWDVSGPWVDYQDRYWATDGTGVERGASLGEIVVAMNWAANQVNPARPFVCQVSAMGTFYDKEVAGDHYQPVFDKLRNGGVTAYEIVAQIWTALANGACGLRTYAFDFQVSRDQRANSPIGTTNLQTGVYPGDNRWPGLAAGYAAVASREAKLLSGFRPPLVDGSFLRGYRDSLEWAVNTSEEPAELLEGGGVLVTPAGEVPFAGGVVPPGGVVIWG